MSVIAVRIRENEIEIGADAITVSNITQWKDRDAKIVKINNHFVIGHTGYSEFSSAFREFCMKKEPKECSIFGIMKFLSEFNVWCKKNNFDLRKEPEKSESYIIVFKNKAFYIENFYVREVKEYDSIGAGRDFALAAFYNGADVNKAIETACELCVWCEKPIMTYKIKK